MRAREMKSMGALLVAAAFLAGCGDNGAAAKKEMNAKFGQLDYKIATMETLAAPSTTNLERVTQQYVTLVHEYEDQLGDDEAQRRLVDMGDELGPYCLTCKATLYEEAGKY
jgi:hypothetical protein